MAKTTFKLNYNNGYVLKRRKPNGEVDIFRDMNDIIKHINYFKKSSVSHLKFKNNYQAIHNDYRFIFNIGYNNDEISNILNDIILNAKINKIKMITGKLVFVAMGSFILSKSALDAGGMVENLNDFNKDMSKYKISKDYDIEPVVLVDLESDEILNSDLIDEFNLRLEDGLLKNFTTTFNVGSGLTGESLKAYQSFLETDSALLVYKYASDYGVDPYLLMAKYLQEATFGHESKLTSSGGGGIGQHNNDGAVITSYNFNTDGNDTVVRNESTIADIETNIQMSAMLLQNLIKRYDNNIYLALQAYNFGTGGVDVALKVQYTNLECSRDCLMQNYGYTGWLEEFKDVHSNYTSLVNKLTAEERSENINTLNSISSCQAENGSMGDADYIANVLRYFPGNQIYFKNPDTKEQLSFDLVENEIIKHDNVVISK